MFKRTAFALVVAASLVVAGCSEDSSNPIQPVDTVPPLAPIMIGANHHNGIITVLWETNTEADLAGYNVYIETAEETKRVNTSRLIQLTTYSFGTEYEHGGVSVYVTAMDLSGNESSASQGAIVDIHAIRNSSRVPADQFEDRP